MTTEPGSDELFRDYGDLGQIGHGHRLERLRTWLEEWRVRTQPLPAVDDEPGDDHRPPDYPDPDTDPDAPDFDPTPP